MKRRAGVFAAGGGQALGKPRLLHTLWLQVHATLELFALMVVVFELCMKLRWLGLHTFIRHRRTMVKVLCPPPYSISSPVNFKPVSSVQFQVPRGPGPALRSVTLGPRPRHASRLAPGVTVMLTVANVVRRLARAEPWHDDICGRCSALPIVRTASWKRMGSKSR